MAQLKSKYKKNEPKVRIEYTLMRANETIKLFGYFKNEKSFKFYIGKRYLSYGFCLVDFKIVSLPQQLKLI